MLKSHSNHRIGIQIAALVKFIQNGWNFRASWKYPREGLIHGD